MSVFGSLFTAVSALSSQSQAMGMISNNIANVSTVGYKRIDAAFSSLVTSEGRSTLYSPGSVRAQRNARIDQQGILQQSASSTDIALSGNGFLVVKQSATDPLAEPLYTRAGSFSENSEGILQNTGGFTLFGWPLDQNGNPPTTQADISSLVPINVAFLGGLTQATTSASMAVNLSSDQVQSAYPLPTGYTPDFSRDIRIFDSLGSGHDLNINFKKHASPTATVVGVTNLTGVVGPMNGQVGIVAPASFDVGVPSAFVNPTTINITATTTLGDVLSDLNNIADINGDPVVFAQVNSNGFLEIKARNVSEALTLTEGANTPLADLGLGAFIGANAAPAAPATMLAATNAVPNTEGWWEVEFTHTADNGLVTNVATGSINFGGDGRLNTALDSDGQAIFDLTGIQFPGAAVQDIAFDLAAFTQFSGDYNVVSSQQNGAELGLRTGISIDREGFVIAQFSNGQSSKIYKLPVATFANTNGLDELTGNVFRQSDDSGDFNLREAGLGSAGEVQGGALEASNVDLADEFSKMIVTQRAYSASTKVISTADQMTEELLRLR